MDGGGVEAYHFPSCHRTPYSELCHQESYRNLQFSASPVG